MSKRPTTIEQYIAAAPAEGQAHLRKLHAILAGIAPNAEQTIKWNAPFFIEPRFLFSYNACKAHCNFAPSPEAIQHFADALKAYKTTKNYLQIPYSQPVPEALIKQIASYQLQRVREREDNSFW